MLEELVKIIQSADFIVDVLMPLAEVEAGSDHVVNAGEMPVAHEFRDVGEFVAESGEIDSNFAEEEDHLALAGTGAKVAIGALQGAVEEAIVCFEFGEMEVGEFHDVEDFGKILRFVDHEGGIPINDGEISLVIAEIAAGGFVGFLLRKFFTIFLLREQSGDLAAVRVQPIFGANFGRGQEAGAFETKDGIGFLLGEVLERAHEVGAKFNINSFGEFADLCVERPFAELEIVKADEVFQACDFKRDRDRDANRADGQDLDDALELDWAVRAVGLDERKADHEGAIKEGMLGIAAAGVDFELLDFLAEEFADGFLPHLVGDIEGEHVDALAAILA